MKSKVHSVLITRRDSGNEERWETFVIWTDGGTSSPSYPFRTYSEALAWVTCRLAQE